MENKVFKSYSDSGHGWLAVKRADLSDLGILEMITHYSYQRGSTVYLEEDCDVSTFFRSFRAKFGHDPKEKQGKWCERSPIRSYDPFTNKVQA